MSLFFSQHLSVAYICQICPLSDHLKHLPPWTKPPFSLSWIIAFQLVSNYSPTCIKMTLVNHKSSSHLISLLKTLQCLPVLINITSNVSTMTHEASVPQHTNAPQFPMPLTPLLCLVNTTLLAVPHVCSHLRALAHAIPSAWDSFLLHIFRAYSLTFFKSLLKYHLMWEVFSGSSI